MFFNKPGKNLEREFILFFFKHFYIVILFFKHFFFFKQFCLKQSVFLQNKIIKNYNCTRIGNYFPDMQRNIRLQRKYHTVSRCLLFKTNIPDRKTNTRIHTVYRMIIIIIDQQFLHFNIVKQYLANVVYVGHVYYYRIFLSATSAAATAAAECVLFGRQQDFDGRHGNTGRPNEPARVLADRDVLRRVEGAVT